MIEFSVVVPLYKCSETLKELCARLQTVFNKLEKTYEIILVNDGSPGNDWEVACSLSKENKNIKSINLSRNFGQHPAIFCGLENAKGEWIVVMDGDLQDVPEEIEKLYDKALDGFDIVFAQRMFRSDNFFKKISSLFFYKFLTFFTDQKHDHRIANFGIYKRNSILAVLKIKDYIRFFPTMIQWVGFKKISIPVNHSSRQEGKSSYTIFTLLNLAFNNIITFSNKPLRMMVKFGFITVFISFIMALFFIYKYFIGEIIVVGYASLIVSIWFLGGIVISMLGIVGIYVGNVFEKVKNRPIFLIEESINL
ncbi:glycosyltransferase family 2 protein [Polaribacter sp. 11A2H]|uniref:glycosyltransferase family 2 protein n=1 Tax=Polaribacter sp. 11A2H TaxID=2687290 RepID=UPI00140C535D|nr:glycosyltransferase family 2 protein [Polaribacter sp. 11A2H]